MSAELYETRDYGFRNIILDCGFRDLETLFPWKTMVNIVGHRK